MTGKYIEIQTEGENGHTEMKKWQRQYTILQGERVDGVMP
jgi:hypothetical protein